MKILSVSLLSLSSWEEGLALRSGPLIMKWYHISSSSWWELHLNVTFCACLEDRIADSSSLREYVFEVLGMMSCSFNRAWVLRVEKRLVV